MRDFVLGDYDRLLLRNFLDNLGLYSDWITKLCSTIWAPICSDINLPIRLGMRSRYTFVPNLLTRFSVAAFVLIFFAITTAF